MNASLITRTLIRALALVAALLAPTFAGAQARCLLWDVSQPWNALRNDDYRVQFQLNQQRPDFQGMANIRTPSRTLAWGRVSGTLNGDSIEIRTEFGEVYRGSIEASGRIVGTMHLARSRALWSSDRNMNCLVRRPSPSGSNDFNGDGRGDILWHNADTGEAQVWFMSGPSRIGRATISDGTRAIRIGPPWRIVGSRSFNADNKSDLLWYNSSTGETQIWFMDVHERSKRATVLAENGQPIFVGPPWSIVGTGDMDQDGQSDIVWHNSTSGQIQVWLMNGNTIKRRDMVIGEDGKVLVIEAPRRVATIGDLNDDGRPDLVLHNGAHGGTQVFFMNHLKVLSREAVVDENARTMLVGLPWRITGSDDFNRDGFDDILWHNASTGETQVWLMRGRSIVRRATVNADRDGGGAFVGLPWSIMSH